MATRDCTEIRFDGSLTLAAAEKVREALAAAIATGGDVAVDCGDADAVDLSFIQLIVAARSAASAKGAALRLRMPAAGPLLDTVRRAGLLSDDGGESRFWVGKDS